MTERKAGSISRGKQNRIFISWSGKNSKIIAKELKNVFENKIFAGTGLTCFVSDVDIASGTDWWDKIKGELKTCRLGILCITKENIRAPWIFFEAGAMVAREIPTIPLLVNCNINALDGSPLKGKQCIDFHDQQKFIKMVTDINVQMALMSIPSFQMDSISKDGYESLKTELSSVIKELKDIRVFNAKYVYPSQITTVKTRTVFISAPMASIDDNEYTNLREYILSLKEVLISIGFSDVKCPIINIDTPSSFDGNTKAIRENFIDLKQVDCILVIYPQKLPSSTLVEVGYGIALSKKLVIFHKDGLPYILKRAGETIGHVKTFDFKNYSDISKIIKSNGMAIFEGENDE